VTGICSAAKQKYKTPGKKEEYDGKQNFTSDV